MQVPLNACCIGGPVQTQTPVSAAAMFILAAIYAVFGLVVVAATTVAMT